MKSWYIYRDQKIFNTKLNNKQSQSSIQDQMVANTNSKSQFNLSLSLSTHTQIELGPNFPTVKHARLRAALYLDN